VDAIRVPAGNEVKMEVDKQPGPESLGYLDASQNGLRDKIDDNDILLNHFVRVCFSALICELKLSIGIPYIFTKFHFKRRSYSGKTTSQC
jgi:hypothetical protein